MIASLGISQLSPLEEHSEESARPVAIFPATDATSWDPQQFAREQIRGLVRQVFVTSGRQQTRQVVFSGADRHTDVSLICRRVGETLATEFVGRVCLLDASLPPRWSDKSFGRRSNDGGSASESAGAERQSSRHTLIDMPLCLTSLADSNGPATNFASVQTRLAELRRGFDYTIIQADSAGSATTAALLAHFADGIVLVVAANRTKRLTVKKIREQFRANHVRMFGIVLSERTFPIPESLYRRL